MSARALLCAVAVEFEHLNNEITHPLRVGGIVRVVDQTELTQCSCTASSQLGSNVQQKPCSGEREAPGVGVAR